MEKTIDVLIKGIWNYAEDVNKPIEVIKQNWDFYYEDGYEDEPPDLNDNGEAYYVIFGEYSDIRYANRSRTCLSIEEALSLAKEKTNDKITWESIE